MPGRVPNLPDGTTTGISGHQIPARRSGVWWHSALAWPAERVVADLVNDADVIMVISATGAVRLTPWP